MAAKPPRLSLRIAPGAQRGLKKIWDYNAEFHSPEHADEYIAYLERETAKLENEYPLGLPVARRENLRYRIIRKRSGHGHVVIYQVFGYTVEILRYFHTRQDWLGKLDRAKE